ncbi:cathepsin O-like [Neocloeon triangulifer]|uniref:cathepsin O-like n=1 Tax=Neocloeon triangulifer TaxID=2078957 RepID=UPI00286F537E|nr:cathepsin O-like [Neocloeon triangulifer]
MAIKWKTALSAVAVFSLCFLGIPIRVDPPDKNMQSYLKFLAARNRSYVQDSDEFEKKFIHFRNSMSRSADLNSSGEHPLSAVYGPTKFSDLSQEEFTLKYLNPDLPVKFMKEEIRSLSLRKHHKHQTSKQRIKRAVAVPIIDTTLPKAVDWRIKGIITPIKNQKTCGACWAFSTIETIESMLALERGSSVVLSVQQGVDCATNGNIGCAGGDTCRFLEWMNLSKVSLLPESQYPFTGTTGSCKMKLNAPAFGTRITSNFTCNNYAGEEGELLKLVANHGPVAVAVNALNWQNYLGGVIQFNCDGSPLSLNHAVQIVGYNLTAAIPYYIVRNSWGPDFGDKGYLYIAIGDNVCGIANEVSAVDVI